MKNFKRLGIFMDHENARFISNNQLIAVNIESKFNHLEKIKSLANHGENLMHNKEQHLQLDYYNEIADVIKNFDSVVLFGPTKPSFISYRWFCDMGNAIGLGESICFSPPYIKKQAIGFAEAFTTSISVSFIAGFIVAFPYVFWEFWRFISPGLYKHEKNAARGVVFICSFLFLLGNVVTNNSIS
jgi:sec-independent protein translocase protein TatC